MNSVLRFSIYSVFRIHSTVPVRSKHRNYYFYGSKLAQICEIESPVVPVHSNLTIEFNGATDFGCLVAFALETPQTSNSANYLGSVVCSVAKIGVLKRIWLLFV